MIVSKFAVLSAGVGIISLLSTPAAVPIHHSVTTTTTTIPIVAPLVFAEFETTNDLTAVFPAADDPLRYAPAAVQEEFACVRYMESRNHFNSYNASSGAYGWYQITPYIWSWASGHLGLPTRAQEATTEQQSEVALWYYQRNGGLSPEWSLDSSCHKQEITLETSTNKGKK